VPDAAQQSAETIFGEHIMISLFPAVCSILAFVGMLFYPLSDKKVKEISEELNLKRSTIKS
jgi:GPH family glycoside/pentoside/hexuronide:cation symporter